MSRKKKLSKQPQHDSVERVRLEIAKYDIRFKFFRHVVTALGWLLGIWIALKGLAPILVSGNAEEIRAFSHVVSALRPGSFIGYALAAILYGLYRLERSGKKRAIKQKAELQRQLEANEPNRTSSNLTATGDTPNGRRHNE